MIFSRCCDKSLWLILVGEEKYRRVIIDFINSIPFELQEKINESLVQFDEYERDKVDVLDREITDLSNELFLSNNYKYWFNVDMIFGTLNIGRCFNCQKDMEITLNLSNKYGKNADFILGCVDFGIPGVNSVSYELINTVLGDVVVASREKGIKRYRKVNIEKIPGDIDITDLNKQNRFVRSRFRKRF